MRTIWRRQGSRRPYMVWVGDPDGSAAGRSYRSRIVALVAAWWQSWRADERDVVWVEHEAGES